MAKAVKKTSKPVKAKSAKAAQAPRAAKAKAMKPGTEQETRLALDRFLMGLWIERDLLAFLATESAAAGPLKGLAKADRTNRDREGERLRKQLFGRERPTDLEKFEALLRQGVDCVAQGLSVLPELQHDLFANADVVERDDPRAEAMRIVADFAAAAQVNVAIQSVGRLAEATVDRVSKARRDALAKLKKLLVPFPYLLPKD